MNLENSKGLPNTLQVEHIENCANFSSLGEAGLESPGSTCPGAEASQVEPEAVKSEAFDPGVERAEQVLFMWSLDAGEFRMPPNVSLAVGGNSTVQHLVLQVHCPSHFIGYNKGAEAGDKSNNFNNPWHSYTA